MRHNTMTFRRSPLRRGGNALLDLAFVLPLLLALTFGAVEYGYALYVKHSLQSAAREGARAAIVNGASQPVVQAEIDRSMEAAGFVQAKYTRPATIEFAKPGSTTWSTAWGSAVAGDSIRVTVQAQWGTIGVNVLPTWMMGIGNDKILRGSTTMRKEG